MSSQRDTQLRRNLSERLVNMIAFSGVVGIGLFLQAGKVVNYAGPGLAVFAYLITGTVMWSSMACLGEMAALFPVKGALFRFPAQFLDEGVGYAVGWMLWYFYITIIAAEVTAVSSLFSFQFDRQYLSDVGYPEPSLEWSFGLSTNTNPAVWAALLLILILLFNFLPARAYGEVEYVVGCMKMIFICMLIVMNVILSAYSVDSNNPPHFKYYNDPYSFQSQNFTVRGHVITGGPGHLAAMWSAMTTTTFGMAGFNSVAILAAESRDLERDESIKLATRKICLRTIVLYALATFTAGLNVPYNDPNLVVFASHSIQNGQHSIFIISLVRAHLVGWPHFLNAFFIFSATTTAINALFMASRLLHALASIPEAWPNLEVTQTLREKLERTTCGVPMAAVFASWLFGLLGFLAVTPSAAEVLGRMATNSSASALIFYSLICGSYLRFYKCLKNATDGKDQRIEPNQDLAAYDRDNSQLYPYRSHGQYLRAWYGLFGSFMIAIFNGWESFASPMKVDDFIASYINIPIFLLIVLCYRVMLDSWDPRQWSVRRSEDLHNPTSVTTQNPRLRKGQLHRADKGGPVLSAPNVKRFFQWVWAWLK